AWRGVSQEDSCRAGSRVCQTAGGVGTKGLGMSAQRHRELDVAQLIYTEADWLDLLAKIATNSALSKQLLGDDVTEENMNERLGMLLLRKQRELAEQSRVKPMTKTQQRDYMSDFLKNSSASVYNQDAPPAKRATQGAPSVLAVSSQDPAGVPAAPSIHVDVSLHAATSFAPSDIPVPTVSIAHAAVSVPAEPMVHPAESHMDPPLTAPAHGSSEPTVVVPPPSSSCHRRKHISKKRVTPIVDVADAAMLKFDSDSDSDSDDDPLPYAPYAGWEMVPSPLGFVHAYHNMAGHTKHFTTLREILHMGDLHVLFQSLDDKDALHFWCTQDSWRIRSWRLYPRAQVYVLEMLMDGSVDAVVHAVAAPSSSIPTVADKGKAPMVDDSLPAALLSEQERILKNLYDSQLGEELAKKIHAEQEAEFARQDVRSTSPRIGCMLLLRKQRELAEQSRVKPMTKTHQRDYMRDFLKNSSASVYNQVPTVSIAHAAVSVPAEPMVHPAESHMDPSLTAPAHGSSEPTVVAPPTSSSCHRRKHISKKRVTPIVDVADAAMLKFDSDSDSDDDPLPYAPYAGWEMLQRTFFFSLRVS
nr:hypothetical protein [Tanacetum cinerariifolium]